MDRTNQNQSICENFTLCVIQLKAARSLTTSINALAGHPEPIAPISDQAAHTNLLCILHPEPTIPQTQQIQGAGGLRIMGIMKMYIDNSMATWHRHLLRRQQRITTDHQPCTTSSSQVLLSDTEGLWSRCRQTQECRWWSIWKICGRSASCRRSAKPGRSCKSAVRRYAPSTRTSHAACTVICHMSWTASY